MANNQHTYLSVYINKYVAGESYHPASVIARQSFTIQIRAHLPNGNLDPTYYGPIDIYANSTTSDTGFFLGRVSIFEGAGMTVYSTMITSVFNESSFRKITVVDQDGKRASLNVGVWFQGRVTYYSDNGKQYCQGTGHGPPPANFVALPGYGLCGKSLVMFNPNTNRTATGQIWDVGPYFDAERCGSDYYWRDGTVPRAQQPEYMNARRCEKCGTNCNTDKLVMTGAIIDVSRNMLNQLGVSGGEIQNALWRFT